MKYTEDNTHCDICLNQEYSYLDGMVLEMDKLLTLIRKYCKEKIVLVGYYNPSTQDKQKYIDYINDKDKELSKKYNLKYLNVDELNNKKYFIENNYHLNDKGYYWLNSNIVKAIY